MPTPPSPAARLRAARERLGLSATQVATALGVGLHSYYQYERGTREPTLDYLWRVATAIGINPSELDSRLAPTAKVRK